MAKSFLAALRMIASTSLIFWQDSQDISQLRQNRSLKVIQKQLEI